MVENFVDDNVKVTISVYGDISRAENTGRTILKKSKSDSRFCIVDSSELVLMPLGYDTHPSYDLAIWVSDVKITQPLEKMFAQM